MKKSSKLKGNFLLLLTALIWGTSFVAQRLGVEEYNITATNFVWVRSLIGSAILIPVIFFRRKTSVKCDKKSFIIGGVLCGIILCIATILQTHGMSYPDTNAGKAGFITALYIVMVPIVGIFIGKRIGPVLILCVLMAVVGMYLLCFKSGGGLGIGDLFVFMSAVAFTLHIIVVDYFSPKMDGIKLSCLQFFIAGLVGFICMIVFGEFQFKEIAKGILPLLYSGIMSCGVAYTLQIVGQKYTDPTSASLLMSLESVFATLSGALFLNEFMSGRQTLGCVIMFAAIILVQLPENMFVRKK